MANLANEGVSPDRVVLVGNVMIDTLLGARERATASPILDELGLTSSQYGVVTLHRPSNVDDPDALAMLVGTRDHAALELPLVFPIPPRTKARLDAAGLVLEQSRWRACEPLGYLEFLKLLSSARVVLTDSGGIQEETTVLGVPCITRRENTEAGHCRGRDEPASRHLARTCDGGLSQGHVGRRQRAGPSPLGRPGRRTNRAASAAGVSRSGLMSDRPPEPC